MPESRRETTGEIALFAGAKWVADDAVQPNSSWVDLTRFLLGADSAQSCLLITVLASILGGMDPHGGFGRIAGLLIALWMLQVIAIGFNLMNVSPHLALASWGFGL